MKLKVLLEKLEYTAVSGSLDTEITDIAYDSRKVTPGSLFVCLEGFNSDGHNYINAAAEKGAAAFLIQRSCDVPDGTAAIMVMDTRFALAIVSAAFFGYPAEKMTVIGLTGTKGKTTTSHMLKAILEESGAKVGMIGTLGAYIGKEYVKTKNTTPESHELQYLFSKMADAGCTYVVMEASSQGFKLHRTAGIMFDYSAFMNISPDHIGEGEHESFEEYLACKEMIFRQSRTAVVNADDEICAKAASKAECRVYTISLEHDADFRAENIAEVREKNFLGSSFDVKSDFINGRFLLNMPGKFNVYNAMTAVSIASMLGISGEAISAGLRKVSVKGRTQVLETHAHYTIIIDYAHNALSMESLLVMLKKYNPGRLICLFGGGGNRARQRRFDMGEISAKYADLTVLAMDNPRFETIEAINNDIKEGLRQHDGIYIEIEDRAEAIRYVIDNARDGDIIALIGKGHEEYQEIAGVKHYFSEEKIVKEYIEEKSARK